MLTPKTENADSKIFRKGSPIQKPKDKDPPTSPGELVARGTRNNPLKPAQSGQGGSSQRLGVIKRGGWQEEEKG